ncbi:MAG: hypothetical protein ACREIA_03155 [Opitutaceae bacterium]
MDSLEYSILKECSCGPEELHVLLSLVDHENQGKIRDLACAIEALVSHRRLEARKGESQKSIVTSDEIIGFISERQLRGECLEDYPSNGFDYSFYTTGDGVGLLSEDDRPIEK